MPPTITHGREPIRKLWDELGPLILLHYRELAFYQDIPLEPDVERYEQLQAGGALRVFTVRANGRLVGYAFFIVHTHLHYQSSRQAVQDLVWLHPDFRRAGIGREMVRLADAQLRAEGVQVVRHHVKLANRALGALLEAEGYEAEETIYIRRLDR